MSKELPYCSKRTRVSNASLANIDRVRFATWAVIPYVGKDLHVMWLSTIRSNYYCSNAIESHTKLSAIEYTSEQPTSTTSTNSWACAGSYLHRFVLPFMLQNK